MTSIHRITVNGVPFEARHGDLLLDAALRSGVDLPYDCRSGHCGTCCVRVVSGDVHGGEGAEPGIVHACQCRIIGDAVLERRETSPLRTTEGVLAALHPLSPEVVEVGITTERALPYLAGQYVQVKFDGYPSRPYSITHALRKEPGSRTTWFHIRRMDRGRVSSALGRSIRPGHRVTLTGPFGFAHFRPDHAGRLILVATNTGFAPIWSIAVAALRENPQRTMMVIAGGRSPQSLYMGPALARLGRFPNVLVVAVCSGAEHLPPAVRPGRPTDYLPILHASDVIYACGAEGMVASVKAIAARHGAACHADPFVTAPRDDVEQGILSRAKGWLAPPAAGPKQRRLADRPRERRDMPLQAFATVEAGVKRHLGS